MALLGVHGLSRRLQSPLGHLHHVAACWPGSTCPGDSAKMVGKLCCEPWSLDSQTRVISTIFCGQFDSAQMGQKRRLFQNCPMLHSWNLDLAWGRHRTSWALWVLVFYGGDACRKQVQSEVPGLSLGPLLPTPNQWLSQEAGVKALPPLTAL